MPAFLSQSMGVHAVLQPYSETIPFHSGCNWATIKFSQVCSLQVYFLLPCPHLVVQTFLGRVKTWNDWTNWSAEFCTSDLRSTVRFGQIDAWGPCYSRKLTHSVKCKLSVGLLWFYSSCIGWELLLLSQLIMVEISRWAEVSLLHFYSVTGRFKLTHAE